MIYDIEKCFYDPLIIYIIEFKFILYGWHYFNQVFKIKILYK